MSENVLWFWFGASFAFVVGSTTWADLVNHFRFWGYMLVALLCAVAWAGLLLAPWAVMHFFVNA
jgi:hypothetical protein